MHLTDDFNFDWIIAKYSNANLNKFVKIKSCAVWFFKHMKENLDFGLTGYILCYSVFGIQKIQLCRPNKHVCMSTAVYI